MRIYCVNQFRNEQDRIEKWIKYHSLIGVDGYLLYNDNSNDDSLSVISNLKEEGYNIDVINLTGQDHIDSKDPNIYSSLSLHTRIKNSMNDSLITLKKIDNDDIFIAFIEIDEFIVPELSYDLKEYISEFNDMRLWVPSYDMNIKEITKNFLIENNETWSDIDRINSGFQGRCKSIIKLNKCGYITCIHNLDFSPCIRTSGGNFKNNDNNMKAQKEIGLRINHYRIPPLMDKFNSTNNRITEILFHYGKL